MSAPTSRPAAAVVELLPEDLDGHAAAFCPNPKMPLWSSHPRVYLDIGTTGEAACPYCGTVYRLVDGSIASSH